MGRPMATSQDFVNWVCGPGLDPDFLMHVFIRSRERFRSLSAGAIHKTVYFPTVMALHVCVPPIEEQGRIVPETAFRLTARQFGSDGQSDKSLPNLYRRCC